MKISDGIADQYPQEERVYKKRNDSSTFEVRVSTLPFVFFAISKQPLVLLGGPRYTKQKIMDVQGRVAGFLGSNLIPLFYNVPRRGPLRTTRATKQGSRKQDDLQLRNNSH